MNRKLRGALRVGPMVDRVRAAVAADPWSGESHEAWTALRNFAPEREAQLRAELSPEPPREASTDYQREKRRARRWLGARPSGRTRRASQTREIRVEVAWRQHERGLISLEEFHRIVGRIWAESLR